MICRYCCIANDLDIVLFDSNKKRYMQAAKFYSNYGSSW